MKWEVKGEVEDGELKEGELEDEKVVEGRLLEVKVEMDGKRIAGEMGSKGRSRGE